jgi:hypothetical protein
LRSLTLSMVTFDLGFIPSSARRTPTSVLIGTFLKYYNLGFRITVADYYLTSSLIAATNSLVGIPSDSLGCPGCVIKDKKPKRFAVNDFVVFRRAGADSKDPCEIGIVKRASSPLVVLPLSRWDDFIKQEGVKESAIFRGDEKLFYVKNTSAVHVDEIEEAIDKKINFIGLSRVQGLGAALRPLQPTSSLSDFWIGKRFVDESEDIFCLMDGDAANLDYLYQNEEKRRQFSGRSDLLNSESE